MRLIFIMMVAFFGFCAGRDSTITNPVKYTKMQAPFILIMLLTFIIAAECWS